MEVRLCLGHGSFNLSPALNRLTCPSSRLMRKPAPEGITAQTGKTCKSFRDSHGTHEAECRHVLLAFKCMRFERSPILHCKTLTSVFFWLNSRTFFEWIVYISDNRTFLSHLLLSQIWLRETRTQHPWIPAPCTLPVQHRWRSHHRTPSPTLRCRRPRLGPRSASSSPPQGVAGLQACRNLTGHCSAQTCTARSVRIWSPLWGAQAEKMSNLEGDKMRNYCYYQLSKTTFKSSFLGFFSVPRQLNGGLRYTLSIMSGNVGNFYNILVLPPFQVSRGIMMAPVQPQA